MIKQYNQVLIVPVLMYLYCMSHRDLVAGDVYFEEEPRAILFDFDEICKRLINFYGEDKAVAAVRVFQELANGYDQIKIDAIEAIHKIV